MADRSVVQSGRYKAYPEYKDSGVEWLGEIPSSWNIVTFKWVSREGKAFASGPFGSSIGSQYYRDEGVPVIRGNNLSLDAKKPKFNNSGYVFLEERKANELSNAEVKAGDLVFTARGTVGQVGLIPNSSELGWSRAILSANQLRYRNSNAHIDTSYLWYLFASWFLRTQIYLSSDSVAQPNLNLGSLRNLKLITPSKLEQSRIANFLDYETAKIDTLIEKQKRLIELLTEKRQAVISHAVTKGLNPDVPMKDSGVEWLGEVPEHWDVMRFAMTNKKALLGGNYNSSESEEGIPVIKMGNLGRGSIDINKVERLSENSSYEKEHILKKGDFLFNTRNSLALVGKVSIWREELDLAIYNSNVLKIDFNHYIGTTEYMNYLFNSDLGLSQLRLIAKGTTNVAAVYYKDLKDLIFAYPPAKEQFEVVKFLNVKCEAIDSLINLAHKQIQLMQERRTALISAAVTGKIDVRDWVKPE